MYQQVEGSRQVIGEVAWIQDHHVLGRKSPNTKIYYTQIHASIQACPSCSIIHLKYIVEYVSATHLYMQLVLTCCASGP